MRDLWRIYSLRTAQASVYSDHVEYGDVCPDCLESEAEGIKARLVENIQGYENLLMSCIIP